MKYYRGKFLIGVYSLLSEGETLLALCDNEKEFAEYLQTTNSSARRILKNLFTKKTNYIKVDGRRRTVEFIEDTDND